MTTGLAVLFEDAGMVALDKPAGLHSAPLRAGETETLLARVIERYPEVGAVPGMKPVEPGLAHRLDRDTSGIVVVARTAEAFAALREQFDAGEARKEYRAVCRCGLEPGAEGAVVGSQLSIQSRFAPFGAGRRKVRVVLPEDKSARVLRESSPEVYRTDVMLETRAGDRVLLSVGIRKGFRHQVRAHLSHLGYPIFGDPLYGVPAPADAPRRMYLHASAISLRNPLTGEPMRIVSPLPDEFLALVERRSGGSDRTPAR